MIAGLNASRLFPPLGLAAAITTGVLASASVANAQPGFAILHSFTGSPTDGALPYAGLIQGPDGTLYGTTFSGGDFNSPGTVFQMAPDGSGFTILHSFAGSPNDGAGPYAGLIQGPDGTLYGTTYGGGGGANSVGTVFKMAPDGSGFTILRKFTVSPNDGAEPYASLIQGPDGTLYGTTLYGGTNDAGTVFQMAPDGSGFTVLHSFTGPTDGAAPYAGLIQGPDGTLYGTTYDGGANGGGTVFQMAPDGSGFTVLHSFTGPTDGARPYAGLIQGPDRTLYGTTFYGGTYGAGTIFQMAPDGSGFTVLYSFTGVTDGAGPYAGLIQGPDGTLYGTTYYGGGANNGGTVFQMAPDGSGFTVLHSFAGYTTDGAGPYAGLIQGTDGKLYGTTLSGGNSLSARGVVFQLTLSPNVPKRR
jgi:uncharacterized repeat protein (TIGR03803 family)